MCQNHGFLFIGCWICLCLCSPLDPDPPDRQKLIDPNQPKIYVGMEVVRGRDWQWGSQDGGPGERGVVISVRGWRGVPGDKTGAVRVHWKKSKQKNLYRFGAFEKYDVRVVNRTIGDIDWEEIFQSEETEELSLDVSEKKALSELYQSLGGHRWKYNQGWESQTEPCVGKWEGITCEKKLIISM